MRRLPGQCRLCRKRARFGYRAARPPGEATFVFRRFVVFAHLAQPFLELVLAREVQAFAKLAMREIDAIIEYVDVESGLIETDYPLIRTQYFETGLGEYGTQVRQFATKAALGLFLTSRTPQDSLQPCPGSLKPVCGGERREEGDPFLARNFHSRASDRFHARSAEQKNSRPRFVAQDTPNSPGELPAAICDLYSCERVLPPRTGNFCRNIARSLDSSKEGKLAQL